MSKILRASGLKIVRQRDMVMVGNSVGFFLELDGDGYSALAKFRS